MAGEEIITTDEGDTVVVIKRPLWQRILKWVLIALVVLVVLVAAIILGLNTGPGKRFLVRQVAGLEMQSGLKVNIGRIDGSLYGAMTIRDLKVADPKGVFLSSPAISVDWRPFAYIHKHVDVRSLTAHRINFIRTPELKPTPSEPNQPLLPDLDIDVNRLSIDQLVLGKALTGERRVVAIKGNAHIADGRAQLSANARADSGDRIALKLDAVPDANRLDIDSRILAPKGGLVTTMAGLSQPLDVTIAGNGSWKSWNGALRGRLGGQNLADLTLRARNGTFSVVGPVRPGLILTGPVERLTAPALNVNLTAALNQRRADMRLALRSDAIAATATGLVDLGESRFHNFKVNARLLTPGSILEKLNGRDVRAALLLDGKFGSPLVDYDIQAAAIGFDQTVVQNLRAQGRATIDANHILVPVHARASRISGLNAAAGELVNNVAVDGDFAYTDGKLLSDNLKIRSDKVNATAVVIADLANGVYRGALNGRVNDYHVNGVGVVNLSTDINLVPAPQGGFGVNGRFAFNTSRLDNASVQDFLGGQATFAGNIGMTPEGTFTISNLRGGGPDFKLRNGQGSYASNGAIRFDAAATSGKYGPLAVQVRGTVAAPDVVLKAERPGLGVEMADVTAHVKGVAAGYQVNATGQSAYGPFAADVLIRTARGPLTIDIHKGQFAGVNFAGTVQQSAAGPFTGRLTMNGAGLDGLVTLANQQGTQRADISARAANFRVPGDMGISIGRAIIEAHAVLYDQPQIAGDVQIASLTYGDYTIKQARAQVNYRGGTGQARLVADGSTGMPFHLAANAALQPDLYRVALRGSANGIDFALARPAVVRKEGAGYRLEPATLTLPQGNIRFAGRYGDKLQVQSRFNDFDMSIANIFAPTLGVSGKASGSLDFTQAGNGFPQAETRLSIQDFQRTSAATVSEPVDINLIGRLLPDGGDLRAVLRSRDAVVGRIQAALTPLPAGEGSWTTRLMGAPLRGGVRYNGPASILFSFAGQADQQLSGPLGLAADFSGQVRAPRLTGLVRANNLTYRNESFGTRITNIVLNGRFTNDRLELTQFQGQAGDGTVSAQGAISLAADSGFPMNIQARLDNAQLADSDATAARVSGTMAITNSAQNGALIQGDLRLPEVRYQIIRQGGAEVRELTGVRRKSDKPLQKGEDTSAGPPSLWKLDIRIRADNQIYVSGMGLESEWKTDMRIQGTTANPVVVGQLEVIRGTYSFAGKRFELDRGRITFDGGELTNPEINISASTNTNGISVIINATGTAQNPQIAFTSTPALPQDEVLSRLLFGESVTNLSATQAIQLAAALNSLRGSGGGLNPLGKLQSATGIDRLRVLGADEATGRGTAVAAGQYITNNIYVEIITDTRGFTATQIEVALSKALSLLSQTGSTTGTAVNLRYSKDY